MLNERCSNIQTLIKSTTSTMHHQHWWTVADNDVFDWPARCFGHLTTARHAVASLLDIHAIKVRYCAQCGDDPSQGNQRGGAHMSEELH